MKIHHLENNCQYSELLFMSFPACVCVCVRAYMRTNAHLCVVSDIDGIV